MPELLSFIYFPSLADIPNLKHAITTRAGGVSVEPYASLNLGYHVGDETECVTRNRQLLSEALHYDATTVVSAQQVHAAQSLAVDASWRGRGALDWSSAVPATDALLTQERGLPLLLLVADCAPLLLVDPVSQVLAVVHAGWRGAVAGITGHTVARMQTEYGSRPETIRAGLGPCLCAACLEIGSEVAAEVAQRYPLVLTPSPTAPNKFQLDLRALILHDLYSTSIQPAHIETLPQCPRCSPETFFSHRGQRGVTGRFGLVAWWE